AGGGYLWALSGGSNTASLVSVERAPINADGTLGPFVADRDLPAVIAAGNAQYAGGYLFLLGGVLGFNTSYRNEVLSAQVAADGSLGPWTSTASLPKPLGYVSAVTQHGRIFISGGLSNTPSSPSVETATYVG